MATMFGREEEVTVKVGVHVLVDAAAAVAEL